MAKQIIVETCGECPYGQLFNFEEQCICMELAREVDPNIIDPRCPLQDHTPVGVALTGDGRTMDVFVEGNETC